MILSYYIGSKYLSSFFWSFLSIFFLILLVDGSDQIVSMSSQGYSFIVGLKNALIRAPIHILETLPLIIMLASLTCFLGLTRSNELIITRSSGRSAIRILLFPIIITIIIGILATAIGNPLVSISIKSSENLLEELGIKQKSFLSVSTDGIWLREADKNKQIVVQSNRTNASGTELFDLTLFEFDGEDNLKKRINAQRGSIYNKRWELKEVSVWEYAPQKNLTSDFEYREMDKLSLSTNLSQDQILNSFSDPRSINFWSIPDFIKKLEISGFSATRHKLFYQNELSRPLFLIAMMLIGATFAMRYTKFNQAGLLILISVLVGFVLFSLERVAITLGEAQQIPILLSAYGPPTFGILVSLGLLLHLEDG